MKGYFTTDPEKPNVYHVLRYCPAGKAIKKPNRDNGTIPIPGRRACEDCERLARGWILSLPPES